MTEITRNEMSSHYGIPQRILKEYERLGSRHPENGAEGRAVYSDQDLERLRLIMALYEGGFQKEEVERYMALALDRTDTGAEQLAMLQKKRDGILHEIHLREKQIDQLDYLRYGIRYAK